MLSILNERRSITYPIIFGVWAIVAVYCILHDQYIVRIAPEHFTIYHEPCWGVTEAKPLAAIYGFRASLGPGLLFGIACTFAARQGSRPTLNLAFILKGTLTIILIAEICSLSAGYFSYRTRSPLYPIAFYPNTSHKLLVTQTIQLTCYLSSTFLSAGFILLILYKRLRKKNLNGPTSTGQH